MDILKGLGSNCIAIYTYPLITYNIIIIIICVLNNTFKTTKMLSTVLIRKGQSIHYFPIHLVGLFGNVVDNVVPSFYEQCIFHIQKHTALEDWDSSWCASDNQHPWLVFCSAHRQRY